MVNQKGFALVLIYFFITAVILGAGYYFYLKTTNTNISSQYSQQSPKPSYVTHESTTSGETANWKTYLNSKYKYEIRYPSDWSLKETPYGDFNGRTLFLPPNEVYKSPNAENRGIAIDFRDASYAPPLPAASNYQTGYRKIRTVQVGSENIDVLEPNFQAAEKYKATIRNGKYEYIFYFGRELDGKYNSVFDQMLSTFKFLDQNIEGRFCGGIAANLPENQCPEGYKCQLDGNYPDAGGKCVKK